MTMFTTLWAVTFGVEELLLNSLNVEDSLPAPNSGSSESKCQ